MQKRKQGFTLVEMLVVIGIIAVLVAIVVPTVTSSTSKAKAATDASNLRSTLARADILLMDGTDETALAALKGKVAKCKSFPDAEMYLVNNLPAFIDIYYVDDGNYYGLSYFSAVADTGSAAGIAITKPTGSNYDGKWVNLSAAD